MIPDTLVGVEHDAILARAVEAHYADDEPAEPMCANCGENPAKIGEYCCDECRLDFDEGELRPNDSVLPAELYRALAEYAADDQGWLEDAIAAIYHNGKYVAGQLRKRHVEALGKDVATCS